jgi:hypothetical protein
VRKKIKIMVATVFSCCSRSGVGEVRMDASMALQARLVATQIHGFGKSESSFFIFRLSESRKLRWL